MTATGWAERATYRSNASAHAATSWIATPWVSNRTGASPGLGRDRRAGGDVVELDSVGPVETSHRLGSDEVAALDPGAGDVVTHHGGAAGDQRRIDLGAVVLRGADCADQRVVADGVDGTAGRGRT